MIQLHAVHKRFGPQDLFTGVSLELTRETRLGLIGRNGCGKSTLLKLITGALEPDGGEVFRAAGVRIRTLSQEPQVTPGHTLEQEMHTVFHELQAVQTEEAALVAQLSTVSGEAQARALHRLDFLHRELERLDAATVDARIHRTLKGLGFAPEDFARPVEAFSGGWQMRMNLAKLLLEPTDFLLLDEPTNHLDLAACEWLEGFLQSYPGGVVVVSHDRHFLDAVTRSIGELALGRFTLWPGNYSAYVERKAATTEQQSAAFERQQKELAKQTAFVERFRASATRSTQAKSREKQLAKINRLTPPEADNRRMSLQLQPRQSSGRQVLTLRGLAKAYGEQRLFQDLSADVERHQRIFLLGPNGCGKTTLFRLILGLESPDAGEVRPGQQSTLGYFAQNQLETLDPALTVFETLHNAWPNATQGEVRSLLARFLFTGEEAFKPVGVLSGGEKSKLALAKLMVEGPNTLLLDEPTNHMDIAAKEVMEEAFLDYPGTLVCVSHDRFFIQRLATEIWELWEGRLLRYPGDYEDYLAQRDNVRGQANRDIPAKAPVETPVTRQASPLQARRDVEKQLAKVEKAIIALEAALEDLSRQMHDPALQQDFVALQALGEAAATKQAQLTELNATWETLAETLAAC